MTYKPESLAVVVEDGVATPVAQSEAQSSFSINKQAGVVTALATHKQHKSVEKYLKKVRRNATAQVLIEAKIVEVTLDEEFRTGINWGSTGTNPTDFLKANRSGAGALLGFTDALNRSDGSIAETAQFALFRGDKSTLKAAVQMMESFGTSRTLSSPRLNALNNQQAVLTFAENKVYFTVEVSKETETTAGGATEETVLADSTVNTVPIGIILTLQPSIDLDKEEITMNIRPTLSRITSFVDDPGVNLQVKQIDTSLNISSQIPVIEVRELDSMLKMRNGQIMVMGGLMEERTVNQDTGLPYVSRMPVLGSLFKGTSKTTEIVETVIFIKATIVNEPMVHDADKKLYRHFTRDPRPLAF
jgi:general secretion pathway protein D